MEESIYTYVNKFPVFKSIILENVTTISSSDKTKCESFKTVELNGYTDPKESFIDSCSKIAKHHKKIKSDDKSSEIALCKYINYWIYDTLKLMPQFSHKKLLKDFYKKIDELKFCKTYTIPINKKTYEELNELSKLYESFIKFKQESTKDQSPICNEAEEIFKLYKKYAGKCKWNYNNYFCWELMKFRVYYEHIRLHSKSCKDQMKPLTPIGNDI